ncbi:phage antirepressor KilAC domain-containing protein [Pseudogemmobacter sonorensis]|uniref:phage antirepressor KilAC domain-containing protein n=1 Tax=Pseudogemmobacter sonorensis TaxID=2989681 RepID=UPI0036A55C9D
MNTDIITTGPQPLSMSSREIAELCDKQHQHVRRDIDAMCEGLKVDASSFGHIYRDARNREQTEYLLPKDLTLTLVAGYNVVLRKRIIDRWMELESRAQAFDPSKILESPAAMRGLLLTYTEKVIALEAKVEDMREDVAAHERLTKAEGSLNITEAAKNLGIRPKDLFDWLSHNGWIYKRANSPTWLGFQTKCNQGLLEHKTTTVLRADGSEKITEQVRITAKGLSVLAKLIHPTARLIA